MREQCPALLFNGLNNPSFNRRPGIVMMEYYLIFLFESLYSNGFFKAIKLGQVDVTVQVLLLFAISVWNRPCVLFIIVVPPVAVILRFSPTTFCNDLPMDYSASIPPYTPEGFLGVVILRSTWRSLSFVHPIAKMQSAKAFNRAFADCIFAISANEITI